VLACEAVVVALQFIQQSRRSFFDKPAAAHMVSCMVQLAAKSSLVVYGLLVVQGILALLRKLRKSEGEVRSAVQCTCSSCCHTSGRVWQLFPFTWVPTTARCGALFTDLWAAAIHDGTTSSCSPHDSSRSQPHDTPSHSCVMCCSGSAGTCPCPRAGQLRQDHTAQEAV
jgi:hypothetical protein